MLNGISVGSRFHSPRNGIETVVFADNETCLLEDEVTKQKTLIPMDTFEQKIREEQYLPYLDQSIHRQLKPYQARAKDWRLIYMTVLYDLVSNQELRFSKQSTYKRLIEVVEQQHPELNNAEHPRRTTVCKYWKRWVDHNFDNDALAPVEKASAIRCNAATENALQRFISEQWVINRTKIITNHYKAYRIKCKELMKQDSNICIVSKRTFSRRIEALSQIEDMLKDPHLSVAAKNQLSLTLRKKIKCHYALQRVEVDRMVVNFTAVDDVTKQPMGKAAIYTAIDCYSRYILGVVVEFGQGENKENVINLFRQMFSSDKNLTAKGRPTSVIMDNGPGFNNAPIKKLCQRLDINAIFNPSNQPSTKPFVESFNKTLRIGFFEGMYIEIVDGHKAATVGFNSYLGKGKGPGKNTSMLTVEKAADVLRSDFLRLLNTFLTEYHHQKHSETGRTPAEMWGESMRQVPVKIFTTDAVQSAFHVLLDKEKQTLSSRGTVQLKKQIFTSPELKALHTRLSTYKLHNKNPQVSVYYDPYDGRKVTISNRDPDTNQDVEIIAKNINIDNITEKYSFDELNGLEPRSYDIYQKEKHSVTGEFRGTIKRLYSQSIRDKRRGKPAASFEKNNLKYAEVESRIKESNQTTDYKESSLYEKTPSTDSIAPTPQKPKKTSKLTIGDDRKKW